MGLLQKLERITHRFRGPLLQSHMTNALTLATVLESHVLSKSMYMLSMVTDNHKYFFVRKKPSRGVLALAAKM